MNEWMNEGRKEGMKETKEGRKEGRNLFFCVVFLHPVNYDGCIRAKTFLVNTYTLWCVELGLWGLGLCCSLGTEKTNQIAYLLSKNTESLLNVQTWACLFFSFFFYYFYFFSLVFFSHSLLFCCCNIFFFYDWRVCKKGSFGETELCFCLYGCDSNDERLTTLKNITCTFTWW